MAGPLAFWGYQWLCLIWLRPGRSYLALHTYTYTHSILQQWIFHEPPLCHKYNTKTVKAFYILRNNLFSMTFFRLFFVFWNVKLISSLFLRYLRVYSVYHLYVRVKLLSVRPASQVILRSKAAALFQPLFSELFSREYLFNTSCVLYSVSRASDRLKTDPEWPDCWRSPASLRLLSHFPSLFASSSTELATEGPRSDKLSFFVFVCLVIHRIDYRGTQVRQVVLLCLCLVRHVKDEGVHICKFSVFFLPVW